MAKKAKGGGVKRERRALKKRTERKRKQKRALQMKAESVAARKPRRILRGARRLPTVGAWAQSGWQDGVMARVAVAREMPANQVLFAEYMVDIRCLGVRDSRAYTNIDADAFETEVLPRMYTTEPPLEISDELIHEIIWGAVEYAEGLGFAPHRSFRETQFALEPADALPREAGLEFGMDGKPLFMPLPFDEFDQVEIVKTLIESVGAGNFYYQTVDETIPDEIAELLGEAAAESDLFAEEPSLWTPGAVDEASGLWIPGAGDDAEEDVVGADAPAIAGGERERQPDSGAALWTPGRD